MIIYHPLPQISEIRTFFKHCSYRAYLYFRSGTIITCFVDPTAFGNRKYHTSNKGRLVANTLLLKRQASKVSNLGQITYPQLMV